MTKRSVASGGIAAALILALAACTNPYDPAQRAVGGGLLGAGAGAAIGGAVGGGHGAALGAAIGGATGALTGARHYAAATAATPSVLRTTRRLQPSGAGLRTHALRLWATPAGLWLPSLWLWATGARLRVSAGATPFLLSPDAQLAGAALISSARRCTKDLWAGFSVGIDVSMIRDVLGRL